ncbi:EAL domain, c-di-GMP-specific phosphodiesterase class I (or its enzymatically inactive variant) [Modestobacter sp. DSM 44400]|uniref:EAL domain-containing protein n=1 Tax=Modestobacter sp. DSM 44400 TaxID=1550230 RepID=UPI000898C28A|nr:EAL domain-containing protein [Modestobacter sp. DSM 44400]SDY39862.1 EAL domain, c-di-GMP-specific phosphodiesterase class I (or its enzymatically inactive variant) [Modestobacter sp. DSM 44400]
MLDTRTISLPDCRPLLADPDDLTVVFQPIVDVASAGIAGYEALARFPGTATPDVWFAAAADAGLGAELEALAIIRALSALPDLPADTFMAINVSPQLLGSAPVMAALAAVPTLRRVVIELTEHSPVDDLAVLREQTAALRGRGALIAIDDAGSGWSGLQQLAELRPQLVKLDRSLVAGIDNDPVKMALAEMVGAFSSRIDAWLLAEGIETVGELAAFARLGVPLAQGWLFGRPGPGFATLTPQVVDLIRGQVARATLAESVASLLRPVRQHEAGDDDGAPAPYVVLDRTDMPTELVLSDLRTGQAYRAPVTLRVPPSAGVAETLQRALTRAPAQRFDPVLCTARNGEVLGLLRVEDLASASAAKA